MLGRLARAGLAIRPALVGSSSRLTGSAGALTSKRFMSETTNETPKEAYPTIRRQSAVDKGQLSVCPLTRSGFYLYNTRIV